MLVARCYSDAGGGRVLPLCNSVASVVFGLVQSNTIAGRPFMAPNFHDTLHSRYSISSDGYESSASTGSNPFSYNDSVTEMDRQLAKIRKAPSKIIDEKRRFIVLIDMSNFKPEDIEVILEKGRLTVKASQEVMIDSKTSIEKHFLRKFSIPDDVRDEFVATELDKYVMLKITLLRK
ncbi:hypothetical protein QR680_002702 [Steinernema hermaphroditum]|uniref:SHSP domain-containing protein n=1 Tax=Steinernema hermaphroditum TaxID=289476 RepID=A0AA39H5G9_9BILA|nr:hypothetical protein QR680_002702 [Steinernema hermaphroditum]